MDTKTYIESGILEQFVLGETSREQSAEVLRMAAEYPEIREEITQIEDALLQLANSQSVAAPAALKAKVLGTLEFPSSQSETPILKIVRNTNYRWVAAAAVVLFVNSLAMNLWLYNNWNTEKDRVLALNTEKQTLANQFKKQEASYAYLDQKMKLMQDPDMQLVVMKGMNQHAKINANVFWNKQNAEVMVDIATLPPPPHNHQYQLWAIVDGKPVDAGMITQTGSKRMLQMKNMEKPQAFAVTIEKMGGSAEPTMEMMVWLGTVASL